MWELDHKEGWVPKNWYFWTVVLEKTLESLRQLGDQTRQSERKSPWIFTESTDAEAEAPILWPPMQRANSLEKTLILLKAKVGGGWQRIRLLDSISNSMDMNLSKLWEIVEDRGAWHAAVHGSWRVRHDLVTEQQQSFIEYMVERYWTITCWAGF